MLLIPDDDDHDYDDAVDVDDFADDDVDDDDDADHPVADDGHVDDAADDDNLLFTFICIFIFISDLFHLLCRQKPKRMHANAAPTTCLKLHR